MIYRCNAIASQWGGSLTHSVGDPRFQFYCKAREKCCKLFSQLLKVFFFFFYLTAQRPSTITIMVIALCRGCFIFTVQLGLASPGLLHVKIIQEWSKRNSLHQENHPWGCPYKQGSLSLLLTWRLHARLITSTRIWTCSSARPGRSQQLEIPQSLNSKQAACFSSSASFSTNASFSPGAGISTPARILSSAWFSANTRISQSAWFLAKARISQSTWFSVKARISQSAWFLVKAGISQSAWFLLAASICTYFSILIFCILIKYAPIFNRGNYFWPLGLRLIL